MNNLFENLDINTAIHCATIEEFEAILALNPSNDCDVRCWQNYKEQTVYYPKDREKKGTSGSLRHAKKNKYPIIPASEFILKRGDRVMTEYGEAIFLTYVEGAKQPYICTFDTREYLGNSSFGFVGVKQATKIIKEKISKKKAEELLGDKYIIE